MILRVEGLEFGYDARPVLQEVSFAVGENELLTVLGPNGSGKTTLLKCLNGIHRPSGGKVLIGSRDIVRMDGSELARHVAYVPQRGEAGGMTVFESVLLGRRPHIRWAVGERDLRITGNLIEYMGLRHLSDRRVDEISGGEFQIVQIARALAQQPRIMALDEPTSSLDITNQRMVMERIERVVRAQGMTAVMTNHDINLSLRCSDRFLLMREGRIFAAGGREIITPEAIKAVYGLDVHVENIRGYPVVVPA